MSIESERIKFLNEITSRILGNEDPGDTTESILETLKTHLNAYGGVLYFLDDAQKHLQTYAYTKSSAVKVALRFLGKDPFSYRFPLNHKEMLLAQCLQKDAMCSSSNLSDFFVPVIPAYPLGLIQKALKVRYAISMPIRSKDKVVGAMFVAFTKVHLTSNEKAVIQFYANLVGIAIDVSDKYKQLELKYKQEKTTTSLLSHELKTPIAIAHSASQLLKMHVNKKQKQLGKKMTGDFMKLQQQVDNSVYRLNYICESIFSLIDSENKETARYIHALDLEHQLEQVFQNYCRRAEEKGLKCSYHLNIVPGAFYGGGVQFEQILTILLDNALKYTRKGSIDTHVSMDGKRIECRVTDTGPGIPVSKRRVIFERFYRHRSLANKNLRGVEGLGLGLYVAAQIVHNLSGSIKVTDSPLGHGSQFVVSVPVYTNLTATPYGRG